LHFRDKVGRLAGTWKIGKYAPELQTVFSLQQSESIIAINTWDEYELLADFWRSETIFSVYSTSVPAV
jgi:hypothetical protein